MSMPVRVVELRDRVRARVSYPNRTFVEYNASGCRFYWERPCRHPVAREAGHVIRDLICYPDVDAIEADSFRLRADRERSQSHTITRIGLHWPKE